MRFYKFCLIFLIFASCYSPGFSPITDPLFKSYSKEMKQKYDVFLSGTGGSLQDEGLTKLFLEYISFREVDVEKGRALYIEILEGLVQKVNCDIKIRHHLANYPFTRRNVEIDLAFLGPDLQHIRGGSIAFIAVKGDDILYFVRDPVKRDLNLVFREPYEEALRIVQQSKCNQTEKLLSE